MTDAFEAELDHLLSASPPKVAQLTRDLVAILCRIRPEFTAHVRLGWRSVNFRHPDAGFVCGVFPYPDRVSLIFENGRVLDDPWGLLQGEGRQVRFILFRPGDAVPEPEIAWLLAEAVALKGGSRSRSPRRAN